MTTPSTQYDNVLDLSLPNVPREIADEAVYEALLEIHHALEILNTEATNNNEGGFASYLTRELTVVSASASLLATNEARTVLIAATTADVTVTYPVASAVSGYPIDVKVIDNTYRAFVATTAPDTLDGDTEPFELFLHESLTTRSDGSNWWII